MKLKIFQAGEGGMLIINEPNWVKRAGKVNLGKRTNEQLSLEEKSINKLG